MPDDGHGGVNRITAADKAHDVPVDSFGETALGLGPSKNARELAGAKKVKPDSRRVATRWRALALITRAVLFF
jgi:hypothetical protein